MSRVHPYQITDEILNHLCHFSDTCTLDFTCHVNGTGTLVNVYVDLVVFTRIAGTS